MLQYLLCCIGIHSWNRIKVKNVLVDGSVVTELRASECSCCGYKEGLKDDES
jgi:hypothetical protein